MGYLWENAEKMDIQLERRLRTEAEKRAEEAEKNLAEAKKNAEQELAEKEEIGLKMVIELGRQLVDDKNVLSNILKEKFQLSEKAAADAIEKFWE